MRFCKYCPCEVVGRFLVCQNCRKKMDCEKQKAYQKRNAKKCYERKRKYLNANPSVLRNQKINKEKSNAKAELQLRDNVIVKRLGLTKETAPRALIDVKREQLLLRRVIFKLNRTIEEVKNGN